MIKTIRAIPSVSIALALFATISCGGGSGKTTGKGTSFQHDSCQITAVALDATTENGNPFFSPYPEISDLVQGNAEAMTDSLIKEVSLGRQYGKAELILKKSDGFLSPFVRYHGIMHDIAAECGLLEKISIATLAAWDLDGDGNSELLYHTGEGMGLYVFSMTGRKDCLLELLGTLFNNLEFFVTSDGTIVSMYGSQGCADIARLRDGKLEKLEQDIVDKILIGSKGFHELEYIFDDNSRESRNHMPILRTDNYIICKGGEMYGDHAMDVDLDRDGKLEQLYMGNPGWGANSFDIVRVNTRKNSFPMPDAMYDDTLVFKRTGLDLVVKDFLQLSAVDVDGDGRMEVVATGGTPSRTSTYVMRFSGDSLSLTRHFVKDSIVTEADLYD